MTLASERSAVPPQASAAPSGGSVLHDVKSVGASHAITIAILAMGGEGGGVLADWLVDLAEHNGYFAQTTSVPGVAQRTGAEAVDHQDLLETGERRVVEIAAERVERLVHAGAAQVKRGRDRPGPRQLEP